MKIRSKAIIILGLVGCYLLLLSCAEKPSNIESYLKWLNKEENGILKSKKINGLIISVKYLPAEYLVYKDMEQETGKNIKDSLMKAYSNSKTFLLTIAPDKEKEDQSDVMYKGIKNYKEYQERVMDMNFDMASYVTLKTETGEFKPVLTNLENTYSLSKSRNIILVFVPNQKEDFNKVNRWDLTYEDPFFEAGIMHFDFKQQDLTNIPAINFWKN